MSSNSNGSSKWSGTAGVTHWPCVQCGDVHASSDRARACWFSHYPKVTRRAPKATRLSQKAERWVVSMMLLPMMLIAGCAWTLLGLWSMRSLGRALEKTGQAFQEYHW